MYRSSSLPSIHAARGGTGPLGAALAAFVALCLALSAGIALAPAAAAHAQLVSTSPEDGSTVATVPENVTLEFNEEITGELSQISVEDGRGERLRITDFTTQGSRLTAPLPTDVTGNRVTVRYRVISADGHPISGEFGFTVVNPPAGGAPSGSEAASPSVTSESEAQTSAPTATTAAPNATASAPATSPVPSTAGNAPATPAASEDAARQTGMGSMTWILGGLALLLLAGIGWGLSKRTRD